MRGCKAPKSRASARKRAKFVLPYTLHCGHAASTHFNTAQRLDHLVPVGLLGHPIFNTNPDAFRLAPDALGDAMRVGRCQRRAGDDRRIGEVRKPRGSKRAVAMRAAE